MADVSSERPSVTAGAVFLSYASEDAAAAERLCQGLRAAGIEVWFDQSELRGGDVWDAAIRRHIKACALFMPLVSANSQARAEGYFRLEWKLAVDRSHLMSADKAFLMPVVIDETTESASRVPDRFRDVQWTHLPAGTPSPAFIARVQALLGGGAATAAASPPKRDAAAIEPAQSPATPARRRGVPIVLAALALVAIVVVIGGLRKHPPSVPSPPAADATASASDRSIAVLPFTDMSAGKNQEYFADGLSEELIDLLARESDMRVAARTSSFYFKGKQVMIADVAKTLGVQNVLEGSVRVSGNTVRVTAQLIRADGGFHLWSEHYDRNLTDVFKIQDEIAAAVVQALKATLRAGTPRGALSAADARAYDRILQARFLTTRLNDRDTKQALRVLDEAISADPGYALAWATRGHVHRLRASFIDDSPAEEIELARADARKAIELDPNLKEGHLVLGDVLSYFDFDFAGALRELEAAQLRPADRISRMGIWSGCVLDTCYDEYMRRNERNRRDDPLNPAPYTAEALALYARGDLVTAEAAARKGLELSGDSTYNAYLLVRILLARHALDAAKAVPLSEEDSVYTRVSRAQILTAAGDRVAAQGALEELLKHDANGGAFQIAETYAARGEPAAAMDWLERAYRQHDSGLWFLRIDPQFKPIANDPRFLALRERMRGGV